jgi:uncharacterized membrane protein YbaN (DUF454 family)
MKNAKGLVRPVLFAAAWVCLALGIVGIVVPVLPTTPLVLLSAFLFANSSEKYDKWLKKTKVYQKYVVPFKESGGLPLSQKIRILLLIFAVMLVSAIIVRKLFVCLILAAIFLCLSYYIMIRLPTKKSETIDKRKG